MFYKTTIIKTLEFNDKQLSIYLSTFDRLFIKKKDVYQFDGYIGDDDDYISFLRSILLEFNGIMIINRDEDNGLTIMDNIESYDDDDSDDDESDSDMD